MERVDHSQVATFFAQEPYVVGGSVTLSEDAAQHIRVVRIGVGERVGLRDGQGRVAAGPIVKLSKSYAVVAVDVAGEETRPEPIHLLPPIADRDRMLWLAEKCAEIGVQSWRPVMWRRSKSVSPRGEGSTFQGKVRARMISALLQSKGAWLPELYPDATVERAIAATPAGTKVLLDAHGEPMLSLDLQAPISIAVGPEGGFDAAERAQFMSGGFIPASLGASVLRFETAGIAAAAIARAALTRTPEHHV